MARRKLTTIEDFNRALKNKYGLGEGNNFKPWLRVQDVSSKGVRSQVLGKKTGRIHHLLSSLETELFYIAEFSDSVVDIREQFPLLPIGLSLKIAKSLDIEHPIHPKSKEPIVLTTDFLLTREVGSETIYEAFSVKPEKELVHYRTLEKLEIERVWWNLLGIDFQLYSGTEETWIQSSNINWATHPLRHDNNLISEDTLNQAVTLLTIGKHFIEDICSLFVSTLGAPHEQALNILRCLIGQKKITVDMTFLLEKADILIILSLNSNRVLRYAETS